MFAGAGGEEIFGVLFLALELLRFLAVLSALFYQLTSCKLFMSSKITVSKISIMFHCSIYH